MKVNHGYQPKGGELPVKPPKGGTAAVRPVYNRPMAGRTDGLTEAEGEVMDHLIAAWSAYAKLPRQHPDEIRDFIDPLHRMQDLLAVRVCQRCYPEGWPIK